MDSDESRDAASGETPPTRDPEVRRPKRRRRVRVAAVLLSTLIALSFAEVGLRIRDARRSATQVLRSAALHEPHPDVGYTLRPGGTADGMLRTGFEYEVEDKAPLLVDVCHPNDAGYVRMADTLAPQVVELLGESD
jgi:hypothetical protein